MNERTEDFFEKAGGSAFPIVAEGGAQSGLHAELHPGMTLRDYFAAQALAGFTAGAFWSEVDNTEAAEAAYAVADAMLKVRR